MFSVQTLQIVEKGAFPTVYETHKYALIHVYNVLNYKSQLGRCSVCKSGHELSGVLT